PHPHTPRHPHPHSHPSPHIILFLHLIAVYPNYAGFLCWVVFFFFLLMWMTVQWGYLQLIL
ncbi:hypothetical protein, partial [Enterobacter hormaechei]